ncbi:MAG: sigma-70 family RNA polymerase sigma factor [Thermoanaerobaculia bacterium]|nr:sigma-70 family RNA polymerase sigma factor [Thermoanaerobaculia bacterium]
MTRLASSTTTHTDAAVIDAHEFACIVDRFKDPIVNYVARLVGQRERAEDVAQETFVRFYQHRHKYRELGSLQAYLFRIATNLVRSEERRRKRWRLLEPIFSYGGRSHDGVHSSASPPQPDPERSSLASEEHRVVTRAIAELDITFRAPLVLREIEGLSYREIAEALEIAEGTVKSRLHRARELLKDSLEPFWQADADEGSGGTRNV